MHVNHSRLKTYQQCPRKYFWNYCFDDRGLTFGGVNENLLIGTLVHAGLAGWYEEGTEGYALIEINNSFKEELNQIEEHNVVILEDCKVYAKKLVQDYIKHQAPKDDFTVLNVEVPFAVPLADSPHTYVGRIDLIVNQQGVIKIHDHKTTGSSSKNYLESWHYSNQMVGYTYGASKSSGHNIRGYTVNILRKLKSIGEDRKENKTCSECKNGSRKKLTCEKCSGLGKVPLSNEELVKQNPYQRESESVGPDDVKRWEHSRLRVVREIRKDLEFFSLPWSEDKENSFQKNEEQCFQYGRCPFLRLCWETDPEKWWNPAIELLADFELRDPDYVNDIEKMQKEELK